MINSDNIRAGLSSPYFGSPHNLQDKADKKAKGFKAGAILSKIGASVASLFPGVGTAVAAGLTVAGKGFDAASANNRSMADMTSDNPNQPIESPNYAKVIGGGVAEALPGVIKGFAGGAGGGEEAALDTSGGADPSIDTSLDFKHGGKFMCYDKGGKATGYHNVSAMNPDGLEKIFSWHEGEIFKAKGDYHSDPEGGTPILVSGKDGKSTEPIMIEKDEVVYNFKGNSEKEPFVYILTNKPGKNGKSISGEATRFIKNLRKYDYLSAQTKIEKQSIPANEAYLETVQPKQEEMEDGGNIKPVVTLSPNNYNKIAEGKPVMTPQQYQEHLAKTGNTPVKTYVQGTPYKGAEVKKYGGKFMPKFAGGGEFGINKQIESDEDFYNNASGVFTKSQLRFQAPMEEENLTASQLVPGASKDRPYYTPTPQMIGDNYYTTDYNKNVDFTDNETKTKDKFFTKENALGITGTATNMAASLYGLLANKPHYVDYSDVLGNYDYKIQQGKEYLQRAKGANNEEIRLSANVNNQKARDTGNYNTMTAALSSIAGNTARNIIQSNAAYDTQMANYISGTAGQRANIAFQTKSAKDLINTQERDKYVESNQKNIDRLASSMKELQLQRNDKITNAQLEKLLSESGLAGADKMVAKMFALEKDPVRRQFYYEMLVKSQEDKKTKE